MQEEEEALARALAERPDDDIDMANGDDDYPDEAEEVRCRAHGPQRWPPRMFERTPQCLKTITLDVPSSFLASSFRSERVGF